MFSVLRTVSDGLARTRKSFSDTIGTLILGEKVDSVFLDELEEAPPPSSDPELSLQATRSATTEAASHAHPRCASIMSAMVEDQRRSAPAPEVARSERFRASTAPNPPSSSTRCCRRATASSSMHG